MFSIYLHWPDARAGAPIAVCYEDDPEDAPYEDGTERPHHLTREQSDAVLQVIRAAIKSGDKRERALKRYLVEAVAAVKTISVN